MKKFLKWQLYFLKIPFKIPAIKSFRSITQPTAIAPPITILINSIISFKYKEWPNKRPLPIEVIYE